MAAREVAAEKTAAVGLHHGPAEPFEKNAQIGIADLQAAGDDQPPNVDGMKSTSSDRRQMERMGKTQDFVRNFRLLSSISFVAIATAAWELGILLVTPALVDGGIANLVYSAIWCFVGSGFIYLSMSEMASMAAIAGSQYHWVSEFAPAQYQKPLSYLAGWASTLGWQAGSALGVIFSGTLIQTVITIAKPDYSAPSWQGCLLSIAIVAIQYVGNVYGNKVLPYWQHVVMAVHILAFFGFLIPIWVSAPKISAREVFTTFANYGGYSGMTLAIFVGQLTGISCNLGIDTATHMAEDIQDAGRNVPKIMMSVWVINFVLAFIPIVTIAFALTDVNDALNDPTEYPAIWVMRQAMPAGGVIALVCILNFVIICSDINYLAAVVRDLFAFARDNGFPFSKWISKVDQKKHIPVNGFILSSAISTLLCLIYIGSPVAVYAVTSLNAVSVTLCYMLSISCMLWRRVYYPGTLPKAEFSLGRWGVPVNAVAVFWSAWSFFWCFWPQSINPLNASTFNWASPVFVAAMLLASVYYVLRARHKYKGPVMDVVQI